MNLHTFSSRANNVPRNVSVIVTSEPGTQRTGRSTTCCALLLLKVMSSANMRCLLSSSFSAAVKYVMKFLREDFGNKALFCLRRRLISLLGKVVLAAGVVTLLRRPLQGLGSTHSTGSRSVSAAVLRAGFTAACADPANGLRHSEPRASESTQSQTPLTRRRVSAAAVCQVIARPFIIALR